MTSEDSVAAAERLRPSEVAQLFRGSADQRIREVRATHDSHRERDRESSRCPNTNLFSAVRLDRAMLPSMIAQHSGVIKSALTGYV